MMSRPVKTLLFHPLGAGDLGFLPRSQAIKPVDLEGDPNATGLERRPLRKIFTTGVEADAVVLLATVNAHRPGAATFAEYGQLLREGLCSPQGMFGRRFSAEHVRVVEVAEPTARHCTGPAAAALAHFTPRECLVTSGSGSYALGAGALLAALDARIPVSLLPVDDATTPYRLEDLITPAGALRNWLLRHRFWAELAQFDPSGAHIWRLLDARQRADVSLARRARHEGVRGLSDGQVEKLTELWPSVQAAFFERVARGEAIDQSLLRAWYVRHLAGRLERERDTLSAPVRTLVTGLVEKLTVRDPRQGCGTLVRQVGRRIPESQTGECAAILRDHQLTQFYADAATHTAHLREQRPHLPTTVIDQAEVWERGDLAVDLLKSRGMTPWPVLGSGDVLVLMCVGVGRDDAPDVQGKQALLQVIDWVEQHRDNPGRVRLRLLASAETTARAEALATWACTRAETETVGPLPVADVARAGDEIHRALEAAGPPTGRSGSGSLRDVDETVLIINPGKPGIGNAMITAGVAWSLTAACPLRVVELTRDQGIRPVARDAGRVLRRLGPDPLLAELAGCALRRLDLRTAWTLLGHGSSALDPIRESVDSLHRDLYAGTDRRYESARQRLTLIGRVLSDQPWPACHLAIEVLRPALFNWGAWTAVTARSPALEELERLRNSSPYAHLLDRLRQRRRQRVVPPEPDVVRALLAHAVNDLGGMDDMIFARYQRVCRELQAFAAAHRLC
ncbi:hypothetical protein LDL08_20090 [Nonomuraea glycinis]|uniref:Uncharacterized protein n=1 Tax=Nonomuraea glycinis TaxID=2047744 RepID=A0A918E867_9ACTN|nr:hypothetical protein [Nonomuraea glycinis]MCA2178494.1 hypothetical protein [Nonomuraea glycinis]GGP14103.1 hypothetical protein GCM10012278_68550 [Nonomuraea glycinis]